MGNIFKDFPINFNSVCVILHVNCLQKLPLDVGHSVFESEYALPFCREKAITRQLASRFPLGVLEPGGGEELGIRSRKFCKSQSLYRRGYFFIFSTYFFMFLHILYIFLHVSFILKLLEPFHTSVVFRSDIVWYRTDKRHSCETDLIQVPELIYWGASEFFRVTELV